MKNKYIIFTLLVVIIICSFAVYFFIRNSDLTIDKSNHMTKSEVIELLNKGRDYKNYYCKFNTEGTEDIFESYIKDGVRVTFINGIIKDWNDYNTGDNITFFHHVGGRNVATVTTLTESTIEANKTNQCGFDYSVIVNSEYEYFEYLGETNINNRTTIVIKLGRDTCKEKWYIDKVTGLITKKVTKMFGKTIIENRDFKLDVVVDEDVEKPDLSEYDVRY